MAMRIRFVPYAILASDAKCEGGLLEVTTITYKERRAYALDRTTTAFIDDVIRWSPWLVIRHIVPNLFGKALLAGLAILLVANALPASIAQGWRVTLLVAVGLTCSALIWLFWGDTIAAAREAILDARRQRETLKQWSCVALVAGERLASFDDREWRSQGFPEPRVAAGPPSGVESEDCIGSACDVVLHRHDGRHWWKNTSPERNVRVEIGAFVIGEVIHLAPGEEKAGSLWTYVRPFRADYE